MTESSPVIALKLGTALEGRRCGALEAKARCGQGKPAGRQPRGLLWDQDPGDLPACRLGSHLLGSRNSISSVGVEAIGLQAADSSQQDSCGTDRYTLHGGQEIVIPGTSLVVQWLRLHPPNAGGAGWIPGWGMKIPHAARCSKNKQIVVVVQSLSCV